MEQVIIHGKRLEAAWFGPPPEEAPTLIFLHEGLGCLEMWKDFPKKLGEATGCGVFVYSRLGYGKSDPCPLPRPLSYMEEEGLSTLPAIINLLKIKECLLIGHSDGGSIALVYAGGTPAFPLRGLITEAAHVFCEDISVRAIRRAGEEYLYGDLRRKLEKYHGPNTGLAFWGWHNAWLDPDFRSWNIERFLPGIRVPLLAVQGKEDQYGTLAQIRAVQNGTRNGVEVLVLDRCRHAPHQERPKVVFEAMQSFILRVLVKKNEALDR